MMDMDLQVLCKAFTSMSHISLQAAVCQEAASLYPTPNQLFTPEQFFSRESFLHFLTNAEPEIPYLVTDKARAEWLTFSCGGLLFLLGPFSTELLTRNETISIHNHLIGTRPHNLYFYEGENDDQRRFREYVMGLPLFGLSRIHELASFLFQLYGEISKPAAFKHVTLLSNDPFLAARSTPSKYISYREDCEAALMACVAHGTPSSLVKVIDVLFFDPIETPPEGVGADEAFYRFSAIVTLMRMGARRAAVPAAASERVCRKHLNKAFVTDDTTVMRQILIDLGENLCALVQTCSKQTYSPMICSVIDYIKAHYAERISLKTIADEFGLSASYLANCFKKETGDTVGNYLMHTRLEYARTMLTVSTLDIGSICMDAGFQDQSYFSRVFRAEYGESPSAYRAKLIGK